MTRTSSTRGRRSGRSAGSKLFETYTDAQVYLDGTVNYERTRPEKVSRSEFKLDRMRALLGALGNPQRDVKCVHVAGSKGKGSVVEMTAACLQGCGFVVGVYTSPHLVSVRERIRLDDTPISEDDFARVLHRVAQAAHSIQKKHGASSYFELVTASALVYFAEQAVDLAVIEVGLGGRLDATNLVEPEVCCVTRIMLEHTAILGNTLEQIAREKAGIFKPGVTAIVGPQADGVIEIFRTEAQRMGAPLRVLGEDLDFSYRIEATPDLGPHARVVLSTPRSEFEHLPVPMPGEHQAVNCGLALAILDKLRERGFDTPELDVGRGLARTLRLGRIEKIHDRPRIVIDGAHTPESVRAAIKAVGSSMPYDSMVMIFGCASDKDVQGMLAEIALGADKIVFSRASDNPRAMDPAELASRFAEVSGKMTLVEPSLKDAINAAAKGVGRSDDLIFITGSFYLAGEAKKLLDEAHAKEGP